MDDQMMPNMMNSRTASVSRGLPAALTALALTAFQGTAFAQSDNGGKPARIAAPCSSIQMAEPSTITLGKSRLVKLGNPAVRVLVGGLPAGYAGKPVDVDDPGKRAGALNGQGSAVTPSKTGVADVDVLLLSPSELYLLGKSVGSMNVILQGQTGHCTIMDLAVVMDSTTLQAKIRELLPSEQGVIVSAAEDSIILTGEVADAVKVSMITTLAGAYAGEKKIINMLRVGAPQQVLLEVKVAEVSRTLLDKLGSSVNLGHSWGATKLNLNSLFLTDSGGLASLTRNSRFGMLDGEKQDGIVRILAEPNIMAISGQSASFLSGGKIFIPVAQTPANGFGGVTITLEEKEFGVGLKFVPTVLENGRINLKVTPEVSELSQTGSPFTTVGGITAVLPSFTTRRADTTVQLNDGQSFAIAGLVKNNVTETVKKFPVLGEIPILGALFRSSEFQKDMTELLFIITPRLVKPLPKNYALPTDGFIEPTREEFFLQGKMEGEARRAPATQPVTGSSRPAAQPAATVRPAAPAKGNGFEIK